MALKSVKQKKQQAIEAEKKAPRGDFFIVDVERCASACCRSLNEGLAYLVLACGTGADNRTTAWSANAVSNHASIGFEYGRDAIARLVAAGDLERLPGASKQKPRYRFSASGETTAFLPNSVVLGTRPTRNPLVVRLKEIGDGHSIALFLHLSAMQNLAAHRGLARSFARRTFSKHLLAKVAQYDVWRFVCGSPEIAKIKKDHPLYQYSDKGSLHSRISTLTDIGALEWAPYLWESDAPDSEPIMPLYPNPRKRPPTNSAHADLYRATDDAANTAWHLLDYAGATDLFGEIDTSFRVPLLRHRSKVSCEGVLRTTHRARTGNAARFAAEDFTLTRQASENFLKVRTSFKLSDTLEA